MLCSAGSIARHLWCRNWFEALRALERRLILEGDQRGRSVVKEDPADDRILECAAAAKSDFSQRRQGPVPSGAIR